MAILNIEFDWWRDNAGYDFIPGKSAPPSPSWRDPVLRDADVASLLGENAAGADRARIVRRRGALIPYRPFEKVNGLYRIFASLGTTVEGLLEFVCRYGPLTKPGLTKRGDDVATCLGHAEAMNQLLQLPSKNRRTYISGFGENGLDWARLDARLVYNPDSGRPQIKLLPSWFLHGLWVEFALALSGDTQLRRCLQCGIWFDVGPGTRRRLDAKFCSDKHRVLFNSLKRSKGK